MANTLWNMAKNRHANSSRKRRKTDITLHFGPLEPRCLLAETSPVILENWQSAIFDDGVSGTLPFYFDRDVETVNLQGESIEADQPRFGSNKLLSDINPWTLVIADAGTSAIMGSGWDADGQTPLAILWDISRQKMTFLRGYDFEVVNTLSLTNYDLLKGTVSGYRFLPKASIVHEGLAVFLLQQDRLVDSSWRTEGVSFAYTQDYGQTFARVEQVDGGYDVPVLADGASEGMNRGQSWCFSSAFPEKSSDDVLGVWFPWVDYIHKDGYPKGGQVGLFRARREAVGDPWIVEPNRLVYETWRPDDSGGFHVHTAGMFVDGMVSFWGDVSYRNRMARHVADDLEDYMTTNWTHEEEFHGAWSPSAEPVHMIGNQAVAAAPGPNFGEVLVSGDEQPEVIMKVQRPDQLGEKAIITSQRGSCTGTYSGPAFAGRLDLRLQYIPRVGYISNESSSRISGAETLYYSPDGEHWGSLLNLGISRTLIFGSKVIVRYGQGLYAADLPAVSLPCEPLLLNPGGANLVPANWIQNTLPAADNQIRRVLYVDGVFVYADDGQPLDVQPETPPPVAPDMPMWELTSDGHNTNMGTWRASTASANNQLHWFSAWHYSLDGNGISPSVRIDDPPARKTEWVANDHWVPTLNFAVPNPASSDSRQQQIRLFTGSNLAPRRWLMAVEGFSEGAAPTYPLAANSTGPPELAYLVLDNVTSSWSTGLVFGLSQISAFSTQFDPLGVGTVHTIASIYQSESEHMVVTFTRTDEVQGVVQIDVYSGNVLSELLTFQSIYFDREDQIRLLISNSPSEFGATILVTRNGYGVESTSILDSGISIEPTEIRLSNAARTVVAPLEWFAVQFSGTQALTTIEREIFISSGSMFQRLDIAPCADFNHDGCVDGADLSCWQEGYGICGSPGAHAQGDSDGDGDVDGRDFLVWQRQCSMPLPVTEGAVGEIDLAARDAVYEAGSAYLGWNTTGYLPTGQADFGGDGREQLRWILLAQDQVLGSAVQSALEGCYQDSDTRDQDSTMGMHPRKDNQAVFLLDDWSIDADLAIENWPMFDVATRA